MLVDGVRDIGGHDRVAVRHGPDPVTMRSYDGSPVTEMHAIIALDVSCDVAVVETRSVKQSCLDVGVILGLDMVFCLAGRKSDIATWGSVDDEQVAVDHSRTLTQGDPFDVRRGRHLEEDGPGAIGSCALRDVDSV